MSLLELYCAVDDFCQAMEKEQEGKQLGDGSQRQRDGKLSDSEALTIVIHFHQSHYRTFKAYYQEHVAVYLGDECTSSAMDGLCSGCRVCWAGCACICSVA